MQNCLMAVLLVVVFFFLLQPALIAARRCSHMVGGAWFLAPLRYLLAALFAVGAGDRGHVERGWRGGA